VRRDVPPGHLRPWRPGERVEARRLSAITKRVNALSDSFGSPRQITGTAAATIPEVRRFRVVSVETDYLYCNTWDGVDQGDAPVKVALPYLLRRTPFDGKTRNGITYTYTGDVTRLADDGSNTETQVMVPSYVAGDEVYAIRNVTGTSGVRDENNVPMDWLDINVDARAWAEQAA
jgi:hypothetical protein